MTITQACALKPGTVVWVVTGWSDTKPRRGHAQDSAYVEGGYAGSCATTGDRIVVDALLEKRQSVFLTERAAAARLYALNASEEHRLAKSYARAAAHDRKVLAKQRARTRDLKRRLATL